MNSRSIKTIEEITSAKRQKFVSGDVQLAEFFAAVRTAHGFAAEAPYSLSNVDQDGDKIQITTDNLAAALAQLQADETFCIFYILKIILESMLHLSQQIIMLLIGKNLKTIPINDGCQLEMQ
ncbi:MAG: hypothetical protein EZS28_016896 [Streblomastix strix]|uniref:PB1 domain-containing protein n=1 Tax=Streblomastix strix TaxID=222440 RepID=A0A5J4VYA0_9EUKA|nr:MAG: hypothetical protein EZS28_016896 [Streblomastix strix]